MKAELIHAISLHLNGELSTLLEAANNAHLAAIDEQSIAETQYDTLAIEAGYLAEGQSKRVEELRAALSSFEQLLASVIQPKHQHIRLGSIVQLSQDQEKQHYYFLAPAAAGFKCKLKGNFFTVITPNSPMGKGLIGKELGDEITFTCVKNNFLDEIISID